MTHIETARIHEMVGLQIAVIQELSGRLKTEDFSELEQLVAHLDQELDHLKEMLAGLPQPH